MIKTRSRIYTHYSFKLELCPKLVSYPAATTGESKTPKKQMTQRGRRVTYRKHSDLYFTKAREPCPCLRWRFTASYFSELTVSKFIRILTEQLHFVHSSSVSPLLRQFRFSMNLVTWIGLIAAIVTCIQVIFWSLKKGVSQYLYYLSTNQTSRKLFPSFSPYAARSWCHRGDPIATRTSTKRGLSNMPN